MKTRARYNPRKEPKFNFIVEIVPMPEEVLKETAPSVVAAVIQVAQEIAPRLTAPPR